MSSKTTRGGKRQGAGKPLGTKHKKTIEWEAFGRQLLDLGLPRALQILKAADDERFMSHFAKMLEYFKPKAAQSISLSAKHEVDGLDKLLELPIAERLKMWSEIKNKHDRQHGKN